MTYLRAAFLMFLCSAANANDCGRTIEINALTKLSAPITLGDLNTKFGKWCQGHGPYSWYKGIKGQEIWFYWEEPLQPANNDQDLMGYQVFFIAEVNENDPEKMNVIWPKELIGQDVRSIINKNIAQPHAAVDASPQKRGSRP